MRAVLRTVFVNPFTERFEGGVACLYNDVRGMTTIAYGDLVNTPGGAAALPLVHPDGTFATTAEKIAAWERVHDDRAADTGGWRYAARLSDLRLTPDGMTGIALRKLEEHDAVAALRFPDWESYPACAQLALHSLWWACGSHAHFPRLYSAVLARDWDACSVEIHINEWTTDAAGKKIRNNGLVPRNVANKILMRNASRVDAFHLDPDLLNWDAILGVQDADTQPDIHFPSSLPPEEPGSYAAAMQSLAELAKFNASPVRLTEDTSADHPTRAPKAGDYLGSDDPDDDAA